MNHDKKKKKNNNEHQQFEFCEVCRLNHNLGRRHNYFPSHKNSLSTFLARFQTKLADVKLLLRTPTRIRPEDAHQNRLRCVFCNCDILELDSQFACGNVIEHLASEEHWKRVKGFMWKYGGGMDRVDSFRISEVDYAKWEKKCKSLKTEVTKAEFIGLSNNIHNEHNTESINSFNKSNVDSLKFCIPNGVVPLHSYTNEETLVSSSVLSSVPEAGPPLHNISWGRQIRDAQYLKNSKGYPNNQHCSNSLASECLSNGSLNDGSVSLLLSNNLQDYTFVPCILIEFLIVTLIVICWAMANILSFVTISVSLAGLLRSKNRPWRNISGLIELDTNFFYI
ncbi:hypothetical protein ACS0TY_007218 [Phlomoides rotata]